MPTSPAARSTFAADAMPHRASLYAAAVRLTRSERDAEDLVQETLLRGFDKFHTFNEGTNIRAWLHRIQTNAFINRYRRAKKEREILSDQAEHLGCGRLYSPRRVSAHLQPEQAILDDVLSETVQRAVDSVPERYREAVILSDVMDFTYQEVADILRCPVGTVMSRLFRGRQHLRRRLHSYAVEQNIIRPSESLADPLAAPLAAAA